jgi:hypothetical protein
LIIFKCDLEIVELMVADELCHLIYQFFFCKLVYRKSLNLKMT